MAVPEQTPYIEHTGNGVTTSFSLGFQCESKDHLIVLVDEIEPPIATWSLTGGNVVFTTAPAAGKKIKLQRNTPFGRATNYQSFNNSFRPQAVNGDFDRVWWKIQELGVRDWLLDLKIQKFRDDVNLTALENTLEEAKQIRDDTADSVIEVQDNVAQSQTLLASTTAQANSAALSATSANSSKDLAKQYADNIDASLTAIAGGHKAYATLAAALANTSTFPQNSIVEITNDGANNGTYLWNGADLTKSAFDPVQQAKNYSDQKIKTISIYKKIEAYIETVLDTNGFTRVKMQSKGGQTYFYDSRITENGQSIADLSATVKGVEIYKKIKGQVVTILDAEGFTRIKEQNVTTGQFISYVGAKQKSLVAGTGISILETPETITIKAGAAAYATPYEYVLCLIAGQSNASYYGGDDTLAPNIPNDVCYIWDNTYNTVREINDGSAASKTCKQTYAPAIALEFYKQTGMGLIVVNSAVGSTAQTAEADNGAGNWSPTGALRQLAVTRFNACKTYLDVNNYCYQNGFIVWTQGERDGQELQIGTITKAQYKTGLSEMIDFFKTNLGSKLPFILTATAYYASTGDNTGSKSVRAAQYEIAHEKAGAYMGFTGAVKFPSRNLLSDGVHYNQEGKNILGTAVGKIAHILSAGVN